MSNASDDLPDPDSPVNTISESRGSSTDDVPEVVLAGTPDDELVVLVAAGRYG